MSHDAGDLSFTFYPEIAFNFTSAVLTLLTLAR